ncbi:MarR family winged helix-turn-helix transcriptional regulator [Mycobacterium shigaense]|uniref:MarR family winged helix-turn-helix transcriptional regulator n=1 Tax=Mycobacterium shigaense TaxID=722731 RepID=UPI0011583150|nr:MarR family transcriptional regulator [Mycobacterium shigaense]MEA1122012.1 MarR family transcriptional regulator [Mycobacterium shigaense]
MVANSSIATVEALEELSRFLRTASTMMDKRIGDHLRKIPVAQWRVLAALSHGEPRPMAELQTATQLTGPSLTRLIDAMIDANLVLRKTGEVDRRRVLVAATRRGAQLYETQCTLLTDLSEDVLTDDVDHLIATLADLIERLRTDAATD